MTQEDIIMGVYRELYSPFSFIDKTEDGVLLTYEIPGVPRGAIEVSTSGGRLNLVVDPPKGNKRLSIFRMQKSWDTAGYDLDTPEVTYKDGVLGIRLKKVEPDKKVIPIQESRGIEQIAST